jgi:hypothetical protein
MKKKEFRKG